MNQKLVSTISLILISIVLFENYSLLSFLLFFSCYIISKFLKIITIKFNDNKTSKFLLFIERLESFIYILD